MRNRFIQIDMLILLILVFPLGLLSGDYPLEVRFSLIRQNPVSEEYSNNYKGLRSQVVKDDLIPDDVLYNTVGSFGLEGSFGYKLNNRFKATLTLGYDYMYLFQDDVLDKWNWTYWEDTYIEFIPGLVVDEVNTRLSYNEFDDSSKFAATFAPQQRLRELRISTGISWIQPVYKKFKAVFDYEVGVSLFTRELQMHEKWYKRYNVGVDTAFYEYSYDLLHFAPAKRGMKFFVAPAVGIRYELSRVFDIDLAFRFIGYTGTLDTGKLRESFPLYSKYQIRAGVFIKY